MAPILAGRNPQAKQGGEAIKGRLGTLALFMFVGMVEGYDVQAMALAAPLISDVWSLQPHHIGALLTASVLGLILGSFTLTPWSDKVGRRPSILMALTLTGLATGASAIAPNLYWLGACRLLAGVGLGLAMPNVLALAMELAAPRARILTVVLVSCGYPAGAGLGGGLASLFVEAYGYSSFFTLGALATLAALLLCAAFAPESPLFLEHRARPAGGGTSFRGQVSALFTLERRTVTLLLWTVNFTNLAVLYYFQSWLPTLFVGRGLSSQTAVAAASLFTGAGVVGGLLMVYLLTRLRATSVLSGAYAMSLVTILLLAGMAEIDALFFIVLAMAGAAVVGSQFCLTAVVNQFYPADIRATGLGYATGAGRVGALMAPLAGATILSLPNSASHAFIVAAFPAAISLIAMLALHRGARLQMGA